MKLDEGQTQSYLSCIECKEAMLGECTKKTNLKLVSVETTEKVKKEHCDNDRVKWTLVKYVVPEVLNIKAYQ